MHSQSIENVLSISDRGTLEIVVRPYHNHGKKKIPIGYSVESGSTIGSRTAITTVVTAVSGQPIRVMQLVKLSCHCHRRSVARSPRARVRSWDPRVSLLPKFSNTTTAGNPGRTQGTAQCALALRARRERMCLDGMCARAHAIYARRRNLIGWLPILPPALAALSLSSRYPHSLRACFCYRAGNPRSPGFH